LDRRLLRLLAAVFGPKRLFAALHKFGSFQE
jgi:hypothetical protein